MSDVKKIVFLIGPKSQFGVLYVFTTEFQKSCNRAGIQTKVISLQQEGIGDLLIALNEYNPEYIVGFNIVPSEDLFLDIIPIPFISVFVDSATYFPKIIECKNLIACFVEEDSCAFLQSMGFSKTLFFPHAIDKKYLVGPIDQKVRELDVVVSSTFYDPDFYLQTWKRHFSKKLVSFLLEIADEVLSSADVTSLKLFCQRAELVIDEIKNAACSPAEVANTLEQYIRARDRIALVKAIDGLDIHIFGPANEHVGWKRALPGKKQLYFHGPIEYEKVPELFSRARIVVNSMPMIKHGVHERLLLALSQGASVLTTKNNYVDGCFTAPRAVIGVLQQDYHAITAFLQHALADEDKRLSDIQLCRNIIKEQFTWDSRVSLLRELALQ